MRKLVWLGMLLCGSAQAGDFGHETRVLAYWEKSFGGTTTRHDEPRFGLKLSTGSTRPDASPLESATWDLRFERSGFRALSVNGVVLRQSEAAGSPPAAEINWWIVGGIVAGTAVVQHQEDRKFKKAQASSRPCTPIAVGFPPVIVCL